MSGPVVAARLAKRDREVKYPDRPQVPPNNQLVRAKVLCGRTDIRCPQELGEWRLSFMLPGQLAYRGLTGTVGLDEVSQHDPGYTLVLGKGWTKEGDTWRESRADANRPKTARFVPEFRSYRVAHPVEPDYERYPGDGGPTHYPGNVTTWRGHTLVKCPKCATVNAVGRVAFLKHEPDLSLADWKEFEEWAAQWLDKRKR